MARDSRSRTTTSITNEPSAARRSGLGWPGACNNLDRRTRYGTRDTLLHVKATDKHANLGYLRSGVMLAS